MKQWFIVHVYSGYEKKVADFIREEAQLHNLSHNIEEIFIPTKSVSKLGKGKRITVEKKLYPGYIAILMEPEEGIIELISKLSGVMPFAGKGKRPYLLKESEVNHILGIRTKKGEEKAEMPFQKDETVRIIDGPFTDFTGTVEEVFPERERLKLIVTIFGRATPVELSFLQVEPM
jgi:transcriptional antiterminator NusG